MQVGVGLPNTVGRVAGTQLLDWARRAEACGFSTLGVLDRLVYDSFEPLVTLAAAAGATRRIRLATMILICGYRADTALLAKQLASVHELSGGRLSVGVAAGGRADDFAASGVPYAGRGARLDAIVREMTRIWAGRPGPGVIGPVPAAGRLPLLVGGHSRAAQRRAARFGEGWIAGGSSPGRFAELAAGARAAWAEQGRSERPRLLAIAYFALGHAARERAARYLGDYYAFAGAYGARVLDVTATTARAVRTMVAQYAAAGCDELVFFPCAGEPGQVDLLARAIAGAGVR